MTKWTKGIVSAALMLGACSLSASAQQQPDNGGNPPANNGGGGGRNNGGGGGNNNGGGNNGGRGNWDPAQMRQRMMDGIKDQLGMTDDEFAAIQPKVEKVMTTMRDASGFSMRGMMGGNRGGRDRGGQGGPPAGDQPQSAVQTAQRELQEVLDDKEAKGDAIKVKLDALRTARAKAKEDYAAAQKDLQGVLTQRQEAVLVEHGFLE